MTSIPPQGSPIGGASFGMPPPPPAPPSRMSPFCHFLLFRLTLPLSLQINQSEKIVISPPCCSTLGAALPLPFLYLCSIYTSWSQLEFVTDSSYFISEIMDPLLSHQVNQPSYKNVLIFQGASSRTLKQDFILPESHLESKASEFRPGTSFAYG